jgi:hypothetical protein
MADAITPAARISSGAIPGLVVWECWRVFNNELVNATATVESIMTPAGGVVGFELGEYEDFGLYITATSVAGTADIKVEIQQSFNDVAANYIEPAVGSVIAASITNETGNIYAVSPTPMPRLRFQITGNASNQTDTRVTAYFFMQT